MKSKTLLFIWAAVVTMTLGSCAMLVYQVDPYFHYRKPDTDKYFYVLDNQRSQNDGISRHFDYNALITGTSMTENFKTSEMNEIFRGGVDAIKIPYSGGSYQEINDNLVIALKNNPKLKTIVRCLDMGMFFDDANRMRTDLGVYPTYLYDENPFNDLKYLLNKDTIVKSCSMIMESRNQDFKPGITSFDDYSRWHYYCSYGIDTVVPERNLTNEEGKPVHLSDEEKKTIDANITQNVTSLADEYPDVDFYYFFSPYSIAFWASQKNAGTLDKQMEAEEYIIKKILDHSNIRLYSFNNRTDITTDLNNYKDGIHYAQWVNTLMLKWMHDGDYLLTEENYKKYLEDESAFYRNYNYAGVNLQKDYEADFYAAALLNKEICGADSMDLLETDSDVVLNKAQLVENQFQGKSGIRCTGTLLRKPESTVSVEDYLRDTEFAGCKFRVDDIKKHRYLEFYGKKENGMGEPSVYVFDRKGELAASLIRPYGELDYEWHQYVVELPKLEGEVTIILNGGYVDDSGEKNSTYIFSNIKLY